MAKKYFGNFLFLMSPQVEKLHFQTIRKCYIKPLESVIS